MIESFYGIFDEKLKRIKKKLKEHLSRAKKDRDRKAIKNLIKEAKDLRNILKKSQKENKCPNCGCFLDDHK